MIDKPSCETCPMKPDRGIMDIRCPITLGDVGGEFPSDIVEGISKLTGMTCHPQARKYLMGDVLEELEKNIVKHETDPEHAGRNGNFCKPCVVLTEVVRHEIRTLIKNGVDGK